MHFSLTVLAPAGEAGEAVVRDLMRPYDEAEAPGWPVRVECEGADLDPGGEVVHDDSCCAGSGFVMRDDVNPQSRFDWAEPYGSLGERGLTGRRAGEPTQALLSAAGWVDRSEFEAGGGDWEGMFARALSDARRSGCVPVLMEAHV